MIKLDFVKFGPSHNPAVTKFWPVFQHVEFNTQWLILNRDVSLQDLSGIPIIWNIWNYHNKIMRLSKVAPLPASRGCQAGLLPSQGPARPPYAPAGHGNVNLGITFKFFSFEDNLIFFLTATRSATYSVDLRRGSARLAGIPWGIFPSYIILEWKEFDDFTDFQIFQSIQNINLYQGSQRGHTEI